jgi:hypothetical protein
MWARAGASAELLCVCVQINVVKIFRGPISLTCFETGQTLVAPARAA